MKTQEEKEQFYGKTIEDLIERWDAGETIWTVEMGGMGPGYEQAIQATAIEVMRDLARVKPPFEVFDVEDDNDERRIALKNLIDKAVRRADERFGLSGAQAGAAMNIACVLYKQGVVKAFEMVEQDRLIQVNRDFPAHPKTGG